MATAGDGRAPYESSGAGGKFRKRPFRRSAQATPYDRPPTALRNNNPGLLTKLVDPASKLIYAGAHKLFGAFRKRLPSLSLQGPSEINEGPQKVSQGAGQNNSIGVSKPSIDQDGNSASISAATGISDLEQMLKQKTFTRSEIQHLTSLLHSRTTESPSDNIAERNEANPSSASPFLRREASTSGSMKKHTHAAISTPIVSSKVLEKETPSPAELAKAYMGTKPTKISPSPLGFTSHDSKMINNTTSIQKTPITQKTPNNFKGLENGFLTPRSRGRSAMYSMARATYTRSPSNFSQKGIMSDYSHGAMTSSQSLKRRSSVLEDDFGSGGPLRRTRQKPNLLSQSREKRELGYTTFQQQLLLKNEPEEKEDTSMHESTHVSVPEKSTQTATKIFQQLERLSPKSPTKLTSNMLHGQALRSLEKVDSPKFLPTSSNDTQKLEVQKHDNGESSSRGKEKVEENGAKKFPVPFNRLTAVNGDVGVSSKESAQIVMFDDSNSKLSSEPPQKKRAFQMSAPEDTWELDDDDDDVIHVNGHVSFPVIENNKPETSSVSNKSVSADIIEPPTPPEISKAPAPVEATPVVVPEVAKVPDPVELKEPEKAKSPPKTDGVFGGNVIEKETGFKFPTSQTSVLSQSTLQKDKVTPTEKASPFQFSSNEVSEFKPKEISDPKSVDSTSVFSSDTKGENGNISAASAMFSFTSSATPDSSPSIFSSSTFFPSSGGNTSSPFNNTSSHIAPASASVSTTSVFSSSSPTIPMAESSKTDAAVEKEPQSTISSSFFATTTTTTPGGGVLFGSSSSAATSTTTANGGALFGFSSPAATSTVATTTTNGGALFGFSSPAATSTTANGGAPFGFGSSAATSTTTNGGALFGFSAPAATSTSTAATNGGALFGFSAPAATSTTTAAATGGGALFGFSAPAATSTTIAATSGGALFGFSAPAATSTTTTTTTGSALFGFSSPAATSTTTAQSQPSFFNATTGSQATTQPPSTAATQSVPFQFGSGSSSSVFGSSAPSFTSPTFGMSSIAATTEGKSGNSTSGPTTTVFGSSWQPQNSSSVFSFGASSSATSTPITFGASNTNSSSMFSFSSSGPTNPSFTTPSQVFGTPNPVFANNNNDQMSMEDSMAEDSMQAASPNPVSPFGQAAPVAAPGFMFGSAAAPPPQPAAVPFQFGGQPTQPPPAQNPFQSSSVEFNGGGGSFSLGSGGDKSGRRIVRVNKSKNRRK